MGDNVDGTDLDSMEKALQSLPANMLRFGLCMRSLYVEHNVGSSSTAAIQFQELRDQTRNDAIVYCKGILPFSKKLVSAVDRFFDYYDALDFETWSEYLPDILDETRSYRGLCETTVKMHEDLLIKLKLREGAAKEIMLQFQELEKEYDERAKELEDSAAIKRGWAIGIAFIPFLNIFISPILGSYYKKDNLKATALSKQADVQEAAALIVEKELIPALEHFINGVKSVAGFFSVMENQLQQLIERGNSSEDKRNKLHYIMMRRKGKVIKSNCERFMDVLPDARTNVAAIPTTGADRNYIEKWVNTNLERIKKERNAKVKKLFLTVMKDIAGFASTLTY